MITTGISGQTMVREGQNIISQNTSSIPAKKVKQQVDINEGMENAARDIKKEMAEVQEVVSKLENITNVMGRKISFNVNEELGEVVVKVIDPSTDKVIKEIPSAEIQQLQLRIKQTLGLLFDEVI
ncbi:MAG: flagellar protein FlaG [Treponemataceae bacterium]|nr:flagellar protein FlaG [Treponemataceae bacterium]